MKHNQFSNYTAHRAGIIINGRITTRGLYNDYANFCRARGEAPAPYETVETDLNSEIYAIKLWWNAVAPHLTDTLCGRFIDVDLEIACEAG